MISRREFGLLSLGAVAAGACGATAARAGGRLYSRPSRTPKAGMPAPRATERLLGLRATRDATLRIPGNVTSPMPLLVLFHGAGGAGDRMLARISNYTDEARIAVVSPSSQGSSWDAIRGDFDVDVAMIDKVLARIFEQLPIDPARVFVGGFSDGASYALSLGLINGDLFKKILAFSPGFVVGGEVRERPGVFISHGTEDQILPFERCGKRIAGELKRQGFDVTFRDFNGGHEIPPSIARDGLAWALK
jgi:phospholipase/carboxylesterase